MMDFSKTLLTCVSTATSRIPVLCHHNWNVPGGGGGLPIPGAGLLLPLNSGIFYSRAATCARAELKSPSNPSWSTDKYTRAKSVISS